MTPRAFGADQVRVRESGELELACPLPKAWTARSDKTLRSAEYPGTAVEWDGRLFEVLGADRTPEGGMLYRLAPWPEHHAIRRLEHYDEVSEELRAADRRDRSRDDGRRRLALLLSPLAGLLPADIQKKMERDFGAPALAPDDRLGRAALSRRISRPRRVSHRQRGRHAGHARLDHAFPSDRPLPLRRVRPAPRERDRGTGADGLAARRPGGDRVAVVSPTERAGARTRGRDRADRCRRAGTCRIASASSSRCSPSSPWPSRNSSRAASASTRCAGDGSPRRVLLAASIANTLFSLSAFGAGDGIFWSILWLLPVGYLAVEQVRRLAALVAR